MGRCLAVAIWMAAIRIAAIGQADAATNLQCRVADPTGTALNVRTAPHGSVLRSLENGHAVTTGDHATDGRGRGWVYLHERDTNMPLGWVFRDYLDCR